MPVKFRPQTILGEGFFFHSVFVFLLLSASLSQIGCESRSQSPISFPSPSILSPRPVATPFLPLARLNMRLEPITAAFYELRWNSHPEAYRTVLWLDGQPFKDNLVLPREILDLTRYALGQHSLKLVSFNATGQVIAIEELSFEIQSQVPNPSASPTPDPTPTASPALALPTPTPLPQASHTPVVVVLPSPYREAVCDVCMEYSTNIQGQVFDDQFLRLGGVTVHVKSLNRSVKFNASTVTVDGNYYINRVPEGIQVEITASKPGYTTRRRIEVVSRNHQKNYFDFGNDGVTPSFSPGFNALSDKPEVVMVTPARNGSGVAPSTRCVLKFSEPMDKKSVEDTFSIRAFTSRRLTVDNGNTRSGLANNTVIGASALGIADTTSGSQIWDKDAFNISWNSDDTEITFSFKEERLLPTDKDSNLVPDYQVAFRAFSNNDRVLKDKSGNHRDDKHFKLTDGDFEQSYKFAIKTDEVRPTLTQITPDPQSPRGSGYILRYSEAMLLETLGVNIAGGMSDTVTAFLQAPAGYPAAVNSTPAKAAENYRLLVQDAQGQTRFEGNWAQLGGRVEYLSRDASRKSVRLYLPPFGDALTETAIKARLVQLSSGGKPLEEGVVPSLFEIGERITFRVEAGVMDPAGNTVESSRNRAELILN